MDCAKYRQDWLAEERAAFAGWDFSRLRGRWLEEPEPWDYRSIVLDHLRPAQQLLDMGTGGGEFLLTLGHPYERTAVTEAWPPNIRLCRERLAPLGIQVAAVADDGRLPLPDQAFDVVINRHEFYDPGEVARVLKPGGLFITQQVGGGNCLDLAARLNPDGRPLHTAFALASELPRFHAGGFVIILADECRKTLQFFDVGAVVYFAKIIEWTFPGFSVDRNFAQLCALQSERDQEGAIRTIEHRFILMAQKEQA